MHYSFLKTSFIAASLFTALSGPANSQGGYSIAGANQYVARKDWPDLLAYTRAWTRANPNDAMAWYYLGQTFGIGFHQPANAAQAFRRAVALRDQWPEAWHALAVTCVQSGQYQQAITAARKAIALSPDQPTYWNALAAAYSWVQSFKEEFGVLQEEQDRHMGKASYFNWYVLGNDYSNLGAYKEAITAYDQSIRMKSDFGDAWNNLGVAESALGNDAAALKDFQQAARLGDPLSSGNAEDIQKKAAAAKAAVQRAAAGNRTGKGVYRCIPPSGQIPYPLCWWQ